MKDLQKILHYLMSVLFGVYSHNLPGLLQTTVGTLIDVVLNFCQSHSRKLIYYSL